MEATKYNEKQNAGIKWKIPDDKVDSQPDFREKMLEKNRIDGILPFEISEKDGQKEYNYRIENMESLQARCARTKLNGALIKELLTGILGVIFKGSEFMLNENDYYVSPDGVFFDADDKVRMVYFPGYEKNIIEQLRAISDYAMNNIDYRDNDAVILIYTFYMRTGEKNTGLESLAQLIRDKLEEADGTIRGLTRNKNESGHDKEVLRTGHDVKRTEGEKREKGNTSDIPLTDNRESADISRENGKNYDIIDDWNRKNEKQHYSSMTGRYEFDDNEEDFLEIKGKPVQSEMNDEESIFSEIRNIFSLCSGTQKMEIILGITIPVLIPAILFFMGIFKNSQGKTDALKIAAVGIMAVAVAAAIERKIFLPLLRQYRNAKKASGSEPDDERTVLLYSEDKRDSNESVLCSLVSDEFQAVNITHVPFFIGSGKKMDAVLHEPGVSRRHCRIDYSGGRFSIADLYSTNHTYINGTQITPNESVSLKRGDKVEIGGCVYYFN